MCEVKIKNFSWSFTNKCNLRCLHCIVNSGKEHNEELESKEAKNVIDQLCYLKCDCIHFTGGECLTKPNFLEVAQYCKNKGISTTLVTNATLINEKNINSIKNIFNDVRISLNGANKKSHDKIRGEGNFEKTIKATEMLTRANVPLIFFITLGNINLNEVNDIMNLCREYNASGFKIDCIALEGRAVLHKDIFDLSEAQVKYLIQEFYKNFGSDLKEDDACNISSESLYLTPNGNVFPCVHLGLNNNVKYLLGNVREVPIKYMLEKFNKEIYPKCQNKKCVSKFYSYNKNYVLGVRNPDNRVCMR